MNSVELGNIAGLRVTAHRTAFIGFVLVWIALALVGTALFYLPFISAALWALVATLLHYFSEFFHQWGHARAARRVGYPMIGVRYWWILGASIYPKDEPDLPGQTHIRRALGGPAASFFLTVLAGIITAAIAFTIPDDGGTQFQWELLAVSAFFFLDNLLVFTLGAFLPLGFTDGSTILHWWGK